MQELPKPQKTTPKPPKDPTASSRTWAIALVVSSFFLLVAAGVVVWLVAARSGSQNVSSAPSEPTDPAAGVKNVIFVLPADMPAAYVKHDQSKVSESLSFYDDEATLCNVMLGVLPAEAGKSPQDIALARLANAYTQGVDTTKITPSERFVVLEADPSNSYSFETVETDQTAKVSGVGFTARHQRVGFKKFGGHIVVIGYGCKAETWASKQAELATLVAGITIKAER